MPLNPRLASFSGDTYQSSAKPGLQRNTMFILLGQCPCHTSDYNLRITPVPTSLFVYIFDIGCPSFILCNFVENDR